MKPGFQLNLKLLNERESFSPQTTTSRYADGWTPANLQLTAKSTKPQTISPNGGVRRTSSYLLSKLSTPNHNTRKVGRRVVANLTERENAKVAQMKLDTNSVSNLIKDHKQVPQQKFLYFFKTTKKDHRPVPKMFNTQPVVSSQPKVQDQTAPITIVDAPKELLTRELEIQRKTERRGLATELIDIFKLQQNMISRKQEATSNVDHAKTKRRQAVYKTLYDNVKLIQGSSQEDHQKRDQNIVEFLEQVNDQPEETNKTRGKSWNPKQQQMPKKAIPASVFATAKRSPRNQAQEQESLRIKLPPNVPVLQVSPKASKVHHHLLSTQLEEKMTSRIIDEVNSSNEHSPEKRLRRKSSISSESSAASSDGDIKRNKLTNKATSFAAALDNVFEGEARAARFYRKGSIVTLDITKFRRQSSMFAPMSERLMESRKSVLYHKQIDKELLHILITRWKSMKSTPKPVRHMRTRTRILTVEAMMKRHRFRQIAGLLLLWLKRMIRCKVLQQSLLRVTLSMFQNSGMVIFPTKPYQQDGSYALFKFVKHNNIQQVQRLLQISPRLVWETNEVGQNVLHVAAKHNHSQLIQHLAERGADYELRDDMKRTPLYYAVANASRAAFLELISLGAEPWGIQSNDEYFLKKILRLRKVSYSD